ncbi:MAG TPA: M23 family metallopeptidase [Woeseiaceae bacterium]|nr:M23 family metallopeptidase [Woeseiaceae bacterium]
MVPRVIPQRIVCCALLFVLSGEPGAATLYKYRGADGEWIYTDRKPADEQIVETRELEKSFLRPEFSITSETVGSNIEFVAHNSFYAPMEVQLEIVEIVGVEFPHPDDELRWVVAARSDQRLLNLEFLNDVAAPSIKFQFRYLPGDPSSQHKADDGYQVPFSAAQSFPITQAYPDSITHKSLDSVRAVDIAMPIGTDIFAARGGTVFDVASQNYRGGLDAIQRGERANVVRILHDDGTFSVYAHLNWNSIRVKPGDRVKAGQYIADSGNTGFSSGPHLHFAVLRNAGFRIESLPIAFRGPNNARRTPVSGEMLTGFR